MKIDDGNWTPRQGRWSKRHPFSKPRLEHAVIFGLSLAVAVLTGALMIE
jgi:hypothetical protein